MAEFNSDIENVISNPNARIMVSIPGTKGVSGFVVGGFSIGASADYNNPLESAAQQQLSETTNNLQTAGRTLANQLGFNTDSIPTFSFKTVANSLKQWTNTSPPVFSMGMLFVALKETDDVRANVKTLFKAVMPVFNGSGGLTSTILAPLGYQGVLKQGVLSAENTIAVSIGKWFKAPLQVMVNVSFEFSKATLPNGLPLYASGTISFSPFRVISFGELEAYLSYNGGA